MKTVLKTLWTIRKKIVKPDVESLPICYVQPIRGIPERFSSTVLITGDGRTLLGDIKAFKEMTRGYNSNEPDEHFLERHEYPAIPHDVFCCNRSIHAYPDKVDHWADVDAEAAIWVAENLPLDKVPEGRVIQRHTIGIYRGFNIGWGVEGIDPKELDSLLWLGSTTFFAVVAAVQMGYEKIVLAGTPLDKKGHWYDEPGAGAYRWTGEIYTVWMDFARDKQSERVRSLSGYTSQILGKADREWLNK